ncbi:S66 peptidase family protein [Leifsonia sp. NPDC058248]|uniref:S66 family peptidase n=1 Tax=Leifsonia sp. NPDC058248 TaxID=3346402 RepID=UPI0036DC6042
MRYPRPLAPGDTIGVTATSSGVEPDFETRLDDAVRMLRRSGYDVVLGDCLRGGSHVSAPAVDRAAELMRMLLDPGIRAVVPPWGGETGIDLLPLLDFDALAAAEPTWFAGYSDTSTLLTPLTLLTGAATLHGANLMELAASRPPEFASWPDIASLGAGAVVRQTSPTRGWKRLDGGEGDLDVSGRMIGGCIETLAHVAGTPFGRTSTLGPAIVYVEACEDGAYSICRSLHGMRLAGFFDTAVAVLVGRTSAPDSPTLTQSEAVLDALGMLGVPIVSEVEVGHVAPQLTLVNGSLGRLVWSDGDRFLEQTLA